MPIGLLKTDGATRTASAYAGRFGSDPEHQQRSILRSLYLMIAGGCCAAEDSRPSASHLKFETRSACSRMTLALSAAAIPVGSPWYMILGFDQGGMPGEPPQLSL